MIGYPITDGPSYIMIIKIVNNKKKELDELFFINIKIEYFTYQNLLL